MVELTEKARRFLTGPNFAALATVGKDGAPQVSAMWVHLDGDYVVMNTALGRYKERNLRRDPRLAITVTDRENPYDKVTKNGKTIGISTWVGYSANEGKMLTLAILDAEHAAIGNEVTFVWGEENGGTSKPTVERHEQMEMRAIVSPVPYAEVARTGYAEGWRTGTR